MTSIRKNLRSGVIYSGIARYSNVIVSIIIGATLARLLTPEEFGIVAIISVFLAFFNLISRFGISAAIVQNKELSDDDISSIFSFTLLFGFLLATIFYFLSPLIAAFYDNPVLIPLSQLMSLSVMFNSWRIVPNALNLKNLRFKEIGIIGVSVHIITGIIAIILAYLGFSYYALVINSILNGLFLLAAYYYLAPVKPLLSMKLSSIKKIAKYSSYQFLFHFINYFAGNTDKLLIGKFFNSQALGFYEKAYKLMLLPVQNLTHVITPVLHPVLSEYQNDKKTIYDAYYKIVKLIAIIGFPLSVFLYFNATEIINILYGGQWDKSIPAFEYLALAVGIQMVLSSGGSIFQATNRTDLLFLSGLLSSTMVVIFILLGIFWGKTITAVSACLLIAFTINFFQAFYLLIKICLNQSFFEFIKVLFFPLFTSLILAVTLWFASNLIIDNYFLSVLFKLGVSIVVFGGVLYSSKSNYIFVKEYGVKIFKK